MESVNLLKRRCWFLKLQIYVFFVVHGIGTFAAMPLVVFMYPRLPQFLYSIFPLTDGPENNLIHGIFAFDSPAWYIGISFYETYVFALGFGIVGTSSVLLGLLFRGMYNVLDNIRFFTLEQIKVSPAERFNFERVTKAYKSLEILSIYLGQSLATCVLVQEACFLFLVALLIFAGIHFINIAIVMVIFAYSVAANISVAVVFEFLPLVMLEIKSTEFGKFFRSKMVTKIHKIDLESCRVLRVRPFGVHTITINTFCDYVVFVSSCLLLLVKI